MSSYERMAKRRELKNALKKRKEQFKKMNPGKKFVDVKFNKLWKAYQERMQEK